MIKSLQEDFSNDSFIHRTLCQVLTRRCVGTSSLVGFRCFYCWLSAFLANVLNLLRCLNLYFTSLLLLISSFLLCHTYKHFRFGQTCKQTPIFLIYRIFVLPSLNGSFIKISELSVLSRMYNIHIWLMFLLTSRIRCFCVKIVRKIEICWALINLLFIYIYMHHTLVEWRKLNFFCWYISYVVHIYIHCV